MSGPAPAATTRPSTRNRYERIAYGLPGAGILALWIGIALDRFALGIALYRAGGIGMGLVQRLSPLTPSDERDDTIERRASQHTIQVFAYVFILGTPAGLALQDSGVVTLPGAFYGATWTLFALSITFGAFVLHAKYRT